MAEFHVFLSYTTREEEIKQIKPLIDLYCRDLWEWVQLKGIKIFYDDFTMEKRRYSAVELEEILREAVNQSHIMTAFLSLGYVQSDWCRFEYLEARKTMRTILHGIFWKDISPDVLSFFPWAEFFLPEGETDVTYLRENPTQEEFQQASRVCVRDSIKLIRRRYQV